MLLLASCGQQYDAEQIVKEFMKENMKEGVMTSSPDFDRMDSTKLINNSIIMRIRNFADGSDRYKAGIKYKEGGNGKKLFILRARYRVGNDDFCDTYYLNDSLTRVVAFKAN